jgi:8-oxo-dGTP pyrophosphatase MutT (NUDIX family)
MASAAIIIRFNQEKKMNELLLIQRSRTDSWPLQWEFPRGKCDKEKKESKFRMILNCLKREVKEEVGLDIIPVKYIDKFMYMFPDVNYIQYNFLCEMTNPIQDVKLSFEHETYKWVVSMAEVQLLSVPKELLVVLSKVFNNNNKIIDYH